MLNEHGYYREEEIGILQAERVLRDERGTPNSILQSIHMIPSQHPMQQYSVETWLDLKF
jgi:hypothetical protein